MCLFCLIWPILEARAEILQKISVPFWAMEFHEKLLLKDWPLKKINFTDNYIFSFFPPQNPTKSGNPNASGQKSADGRHKKRVRQPHSTTERQRQKALGRGEYLMQPGGQQPGQQLQPELDPHHGMNNYHPQENHNHNFESQPEALAAASAASMGGGGQQFQERPNSIDVKSAAYYQQLQLQVNLIKNPTISKKLNFPAKNRCAFFAIWTENVRR